MEGKIEKPDFEPYGEEWKKEMMKWRKEDLIAIIRVKSLKIKAMNDELVKRFEEK